MTLKQLHSLTAVIGANGGWINNIVVTNLLDRMKRRKAVQNFFNSHNMHPVCKKALK